VIAGRCNRLGCAQFGCPVTLDLCQGCPVRQAATVYKPKSIRTLIAEMETRGKAGTAARIAAGKK
jgi:hypothetical protein